MSKPKSDSKFDYTPMSEEYNEVSDFIYCYIKEYNMTIVVDKLKEPETNNHLIARINDLINIRFDIFESKVKEFNMFQKLTYEEKARQALTAISEWNPGILKKSMKEKVKIINKYISYKEQIPEL